MLDFNYSFDKIDLKKKCKKSEFLTQNDPM